MKVTEVRAKGLQKIWKIYHILKHKKEIKIERETT